MLDPIKYQTKIEFEKFPLHWIPRLEIFHSDLEHFPLHYIHFTLNNERVYGCPISFEIKNIIDSYCDIEFLLISNVDLNSNTLLKTHTKIELENRIGFSDKISIKDVHDICKHNKKYVKFFTNLWKIISSVYGNYIPFGRFFEESYSILRFHSAGNSPKTGKQQEMRTTYWFLESFGEKIKIENEWKFIEYFLIPNYDDILSGNFAKFPKFNDLFSVSKKIWNLEYRKKYKIGAKTFKTYSTKLPRSRQDISGFYKSKLKEKELKIFENLVDAFNRLPLRAYQYIWSIMNIIENDYRKWTKKEFEKFYIESNKGPSPKVIGCFLQQGFNKEVIPIDTWIETFIRFTLGMNNPDKRSIDKTTIQSFFSSFSLNHKLERIIWIAAQANKTNKSEFFDILWCMRFGVQNEENKNIRQNNPVSCYKCKFRKYCIGFEKIKSENVLVVEKKDFNIKTNELKTNKLKKIFSSQQCRFICVTEDKVPKKVLISTNNKWHLHDEHSGLTLYSKHATKHVEKLITVDKFVKGLPDYFSINE